MVVYTKEEWCMCLDVELNGDVDKVDKKKGLVNNLIQYEKQDK